MRLRVLQFFQCWLSDILLAMCSGVLDLFRAKYQRMNNMQLKSFLTAMYLIQIEAYMPSKHNAQVMNRVVYDTTLHTFLPVVHATRQYNKNFHVPVEKGRS